MYSTAGLIFLILFGLASIFQLVVCFLEKEKLRRISKPFCVLFLAIAAILFFPNQPIPYIGAFLGVLGDILLLFKKKFVCFVIGALFFTAGHILYATQMILILNQYITIPFYAYIIVVVGLIALTFGLYPLTKKAFGKAALVGDFYMPFLLVLLGLGIAVACVYTKSPWPGICIAMGYCLFLASDSVLIFTNFIRDIKRRDFYIMITYLAAEFCIILGFILYFN